mgnify:FL=1
MTGDRGLSVRTAGMIAFVAGLLTRAVHVIGYLLGTRTELYYWPVLACRKFESAALGLLQGSPPEGPFTYASPLYRYFLLPFYASGTGRTGLFVFQSLLGATAAWMLFRLALRAGAGTRTALAAAVIWCLYAPAVFLELTILPVSLLTLIVTWFTLIQTGSRSGSVRSAGSGLLAGVMAGLRPPFVFLLAPTLWKRVRGGEGTPAALAAAGVALPLVFLSFQQKAMGGGFYPFPRTAGCNLALGHSSESTGYGPPVPSLGLVETGRGDIHDVAARVAADLGYGTPEEADAYWTDTALSWIRDHPVEELRLIAVKLGGFFGHRPFDSYYELGRAGSFNPVLKFYAVPRPAVVILFLVGLVPFLIGGSHRLVVLAPVAVSMLSSVVFVHSERFFAPVIPCMAAAGAAGIAILIREIRRGGGLRWAAAGAAGLLLMIPSVSFPVPSVPEPLYIGSLAVRAYHMEDYELALTLFERAAMTAERGTVVWVQGHSEAARIAEALGYSERARQHRQILAGEGFLEVP